MVVLICIESCVLAAFAVFGVVSVFGIVRGEVWNARRTRELVVYLAMLVVAVAAFALAGASADASASASAGASVDAGASASASASASMSASASASMSASASASASASGSDISLILLTIFLTVVCVLLAVSTACVIPRRRWTPQGPVDAIVIMGCGVRPDGSPRRMLSRRVGAAYAFARAQRDAGTCAHGTQVAQTVGVHEATQLAARAQRDATAQGEWEGVQRDATAQGEWPLIVCAGGQGCDEPTTEAQVMGWILHERGVPCERLVLERCSTDSVENIAFACQVLAQRLRMQEVAQRDTLRETSQETSQETSRDTLQETSRDTSRETSQTASSTERMEEPSAAQPRIAFCTSSFHLFRTRREARRQGLEGYVIGSLTKWPYWANEIMHVCVLPLYWLIRCRTRNIPHTSQSDGGVCAERDIPGPNREDACRNAPLYGMSLELYLGLND